MHAHLSHNMEAHRCTESLKYVVFTYVMYIQERQRVFVYKFIFMFPYDYIQYDYTDVIPCCANVYILCSKIAWD